MLRLDLLRDLARDAKPGRAEKPAPSVEVPKKPEKTVKPPKRREPQDGSGAGRRALVAALILVIAGAGLVYLAGPKRFASLPDFAAGVTAKRAAEARADSLKSEALRAKASRAVDEGLALSIEWLNQLETLPLGDSAWMLDMASFTPPGRFVLTGIARHEESISAVQEALVLFPGAEVSDSRSERRAKPDSGYAFGFGFGGTLSLASEDSLPPLDRTIPAARLDAELNALRDGARAAGLSLSPPEPGPTSTGAGLQARSYRIAGSCDSAGFEGIRAFLQAERSRGSPFGIRRLTMQGRRGQQTVFLDIMAFTR